MRTPLASGKRALVSATWANVLGTVNYSGDLYILDKDLDSDSDDIAATVLEVGLLNATGTRLAAATIASNNDYAATYMRVLLNYFNRASVPVGAYQGSSISGGSASAYTQGAAASFGHTETRSSYTDAVTVLRTALARARNGQVKIIVGGTCTNIAALLASSADGISPLTGAQLVTAKVRSIHIMGGRFDGDTTSTENNVGYDNSAAQAVATFSGCPKYWAGYEVGALVNTRIDPAADITLDPSKNGWDLFMTPDVAGRHASFDLMASLNGFLGTASGTFSINGPGDITFTAGATSYSANVSGSNYYLTKNVSDGTIAALCETYMNACTAAYHPLDTNPDAFSLGSRLNAEISTLYESASVTVAGLYNGGPAPVSITTGEYSKNGGAYTTAAGSATNGDTFTVRKTSSGSYETDATTTLTIGTKSSTYTVTTRAAAFVYDTDAAALFARHSNVWPDAWKMACNNFIVGAKADGVWAKLDVFTLTADPTSDTQRATRNWKQDLYNSTQVGTGTFNTNGWQGNGSNGYLDPAYLFTSQNSSHLGCYSLTESNVTASDMGNSTSLLAARSGGNMAWRVNQGTTNAPTVGSSVGSFIASRTGATAVSGYREGTLISGSSTSSTAIPADAIRFGGRGGTVSFSVRRLPVFHTGSGLTGTEAAALASRISALLSELSII
jgi:hypothetical protein